MRTIEVSLPLAGAITIALIVVLGIFVYPLLLAQRYGIWVVALLTVFLGVLFIVFQGAGSGGYSSLLAAGWALGPVLAAVIVRRIERKSGPGH